MLFDLSNRNKNKDIFFIGIEIDRLQYEESCALTTSAASNILFVNDDIENVVTKLEDDTVNMFISILPHPTFIGSENVTKWKPFYIKMLRKMKDHGQFLLITECTNEFFSPVSIEEYKKWRNWITSSFIDMGYRILLALDDSPSGFSSYYLDQFKHDTNRIKVLTLLLEKIT